jgi:hypothetical protein
MHACGISHIIGKFSTRVTNLIKLHFNLKSSQEVMGLQSGESPNFKNFKTPNLGVLGKMTFDATPWLITDIAIRGKVLASPSSGCDESYDSVYAHGSSMYQKCFNFALNNLLFDLCRSI